jgi:hypothetical protein
MIFLTEEQVKARLNSQDNLAKNPTENRNPKNIVSEEVLVTPIHNGGRRNGDTNIPPFIRELVGTFANMEPSKAVAEVFGVSKSQADQYKSGCVTPGVPDPNLISQLNKNLSRAHELAIEKMVASLEGISETDIKNARVRDKASIARDLASVAEKLTPKELPKERGDFQLIVYSPTVRTENFYETKEVITPVAKDAKITD